MPSHKIYFKNTTAEQLAARLELPVNQKPIAYALFAHCFTCNKNLTAVRNISRSLNLNGIAVLRFDFTGLGESEGDFADTNFSSNVQDLVSAAKFLEENYQAPSLLVGHSLGGAAVIAAAEYLSSVKAVATIGAPFDPSHVSHLFAAGIEEIKEEGIANVQIGGRPFTVKKQFLEDIKEANLTTNLENFNRALLIMHSPQDMTVEVENAAKIYSAAKHPKSFVTLDGADHLLTNKEDSQYAGEVIGTWAKRYLDIQPKEILKPEKTVAVRLAGEGYTTEVMVRHHHLTADEPASVGGNDFGPGPYELVAAGLGACTVMTLKMYARRKKWDLQEVTVHLDHFKDYKEDAQNTDNPKSKIDYFHRIIDIKGNLDEKQIARLLEVADRCPVHRSLHSEVKTETILKH
ncbi:MAG: bifunctional alpha/beta hydrolase/OsmC family protein [Saprospiraceae bacterium]|nr:bifunctional alpha/beta hydrolase/OsmC family protein [Saprospiraceae bacterium]